MPEEYAQRVLKKRSRNGCRTCRKRHQKCDERKPTCFNCRLRGVECGGYKITLGDFTAYSGIEGQMVSRVRRDSECSGREGGGEGDAAMAATVVGTPRTGLIPESNCDLLQPQSQSTAVLAHLDDSHEADSLTLGMLEMDPGRYLNSPLDFDALGSWSPEGYQAGEDDPEHTDGVQALELALFDPTPEPVIHATPRDPFDQYLFTYYMDTLYLRLYPIKLDQNPYRVVYGSLATESEPLLKVIMLASASHLAKQGKLPAFAIQHYRTAVQDSFRDALSTNKEDSWVLGATVLLSIVLDIIGTSIDTWSAKLIGCRRLLEGALRTSAAQQQTPVGLQCLLVQYNWAVTMGKAMLKGSVSADVIDELRCIDEVDATTDRDSNLSPTLDLSKHQSHWWDNLPDYEMHLLLREATDYAVTVDRLRTAITATATTPPASTTIDSLLHLMPHIADLIHRIESWSPQPPSIRPEYSASITHFNSVWRAGMLCFVYSEIYALDARDPRIQACVETALAALAELSWLQACLFPFFMVAVHALGDGARGVFVGKLVEMHARLGFQGPLDVVAVLRGVWERVDGDVGGGRVEWRSVVRGLGMELNILL
ncbi:fungal-specific transcription factor domain-containing protein [Aspergillus pseudodeflectus]|uniref:Fungal-specific transcription factor domain-containing protein n=1 Tax=Aspergillus pseudodeflectus TaxID=176178 RepID=A0ABR4JIT6_9EURO